MKQRPQTPPVKVTELGFPPPHPPAKSVWERWHIMLGVFVAITVLLGYFGVRPS